MLPTIVHIGYHKTGTSFLQNVFAVHPRVAYASREAVRQQLLDIAPLRFDIEVLQDWLSGLSNDAQALGKCCLVLSEEELSGNIHTDGNGGFVQKVVADRFYAANPQAQIVVVVRNQADAIESAYRQYVKMGGALSANAYVRSENRRVRRYRFPQFSLEHFEYDVLVDYYRRLFGAERVHVFIYEKMRRDQHAFLLDLWDRTGIPRPCGELPVSKANVSWAYVCIVAARLTNRFYGDDPVNRRVILKLPAALWYTPLRSFYARMSGIAAVRRFGASRHFLKGTLRDETHNHFAESNGRLSAMIGEDLSRFGYATPR
jgi:hypothetical protein